MFLKILLTRASIHTIQEIQDGDKKGIGFSGIIKSVDKNFKDQIEETNDRLKSHCEGNGFIMQITIMLMRNV